MNEPSSYCIDIDVQCLSQAYFEGISKILDAENAYQSEKLKAFLTEKLNVLELEVLAKENEI